MQRDIVEKARRGSRSAFEQIVSSEIGRLQALATLLIHDRSLAEDAVQETLFQAWRDLPHLRDADRFGPWLHSVLVHRCVDLARRRRAEDAAVLPAGLVDSNDLQADAASRDVVRRGMRRLKPQQRSALILRYYLGLSVPEIAERLGVPLGTAKSRLHSAEAAMRMAVLIDGGLAGARRAA